MSGAHLGSGQRRDSQSRHPIIFDLNKATQESVNHLESIFSGVVRLSQPDNLCYWRNIGIKTTYIPDGIHIVITTMLPFASFVHLRPPRFVK